MVSRTEPLHNAQASHLGFGVPLGGLGGNAD